MFSFPSIRQSIVATVAHAVVFWAKKVLRVRVDQSELWSKGNELLPDPSL